ncbi:MAG: guanylate kinase [Ruminococcaceae bacterium]|nr:guanylate kinase [Oscillospiraceae bacterium]
MKPQVLIVSGFAGSGKGTVFKIASTLFPKLKLSVSMTTRAPRPGEIDGVHYYFVTKEEFLKTLSANGFFEHTEYCGNYYGTPKKQFFQMVEEGFTPVLEIETDGALQAMKELDSYASVFLSPPDFKTLEERLRGRGTETEQSILRRLSTAKEELELIREYQHLIVNYNGRSEDAAKAIAQIAETGESDSSVIIRDKEAFIENFLK